MLRPHTRTLRSIAFNESCVSFDENRIASSDSFYFTYARSDWGQFLLFFASKLFFIASFQVIFVALGTKLSIHKRMSLSKRMTNKVDVEMKTKIKNLFRKEVSHFVVDARENHAYFDSMNSTNKWRRHQFLSSPEKDSKWKIITIY